MIIFGHNKFGLVQIKGSRVKVCTVSFERPVNYLCDTWHVFRPSTKRGLILIGLELNANARESFEHC